MQITVTLKKSFLTGKKTHVPNHGVHRVSRVLFGSDGDKIRLVWRPGGQVSDLYHVWNCGGRHCTWFSVNRLSKHSVRCLIRSSNEPAGKPWKDRNDLKVSFNIVQFIQHCSVPPIRLIAQFCIEKRQHHLPRWRIQP